MSASGEDRVSRFERHCGLLLRAYPAAYRSERTEEIIGTLLETTPEGREWPLPRDIRGLVAGGLSARAALSRRNTAAVNLRVAVLVGVAAYLAYVVAGDLGALLFAAEHGTVHLGGASASPFGWPTLVVAALTVVALVLAWLSRRRAVALAGAAPAAAAIGVVGPWGSFASGFAVTELICLAVLVALAGPQRPERRWLWPIVLIVVAEVLPAMQLGQLVLLSLLLLFLVVSIAWLAIDARPAIAMVTLVLMAYLPPAIGNFAMPATWPELAICVVVAAPALWLLRRQSAHPGRPSVS
jgi:hypothetical protein